jgi:pimeloyl-ACP methyl ester carboxylesterase
MDGYADVNGVRLWYEIAGSGPALVMLHGHLIDSGQWDVEMASFASEFRVVRYDARGFGRSDRAEGPFSYHEDLRGLLDCLGIEQALLMGCSGGGSTIVDFALAYPARALALVLVGSSVSGYRPDGPPPPKMAEWNEARERRDVERTVELGLEISTDGGRRPDQVNPEARERTREMMTRLFSRQLASAEAAALDPPATGRLGEIQAPVLAVMGEHDLPIIFNIADIVVAEVARARRVVIPDAGHHPNMEHPALFDEVVRPFLRSALP